MVSQIKQFAPNVKCAVKPVTLNFSNQSEKLDTVTLAGSGMCAGHHANPLLVYLKFERII